MRVRRVDDVQVAPFQRTCRRGKIRLRILAAHASVFVRMRAIIMFSAGTDSDNRKGDRNE